MSNKTIILFRSSIKSSGRDIGVPLPVTLHCWQKPRTCFKCNQQIPLRFQYILLDNFCTVHPMLTTPPTAHTTSIIAHVDHGKTTIMDSIVAAHGHISKSLAGDIRYLDSREDEQKREITLKLSPISLDDNRVFIDTPGHVDFESLIFASSILSDTHIIVIDVNEGITPRAYSLIKYIEPAATILILNKIDKCENSETPQRIVHEMNGLVGGDVFSWKIGNVILSDALNCCGICSLTFSLSTKNSLKTAFKAYKLLSSTYDLSEKTSDEAKVKVKELMKKYHVSYKNKKGILSAVMPLHIAIFKSLDNLPSSSSVKLITQFYKIELKNNANNNQSFIGIIASGRLYESGKYTQDNILFICKVLRGTVKKDTEVYTTSPTKQQLIKIRHIYKFVFDLPVEVENSDGLSLICIQGDFLKDSVVSEEPVDFALTTTPVPLFRSKLILEDLKQLPEMKEAIRTISYVDPLKARKNRFSEIEVQCSGQVQFEKICYDLAGAGFRFAMGASSRECRETITAEGAVDYKTDDLEFRIEMKGRGDEDLASNISTLNINRKVIAKGSNRFVIECSVSPHIVESVLEIFTESGPFIKEKVIHIEITVLFTKEDPSTMYNVLKNELTKLYLTCKPALCPLLFSVRILVERTYLGVVYSLLQRIHYIMSEEGLDDGTGFSVIKCKIPQFYLGTLAEELRIKTRGTGYLEASQDEYERLDGLDDVAEEIRHEKALISLEKLVENPEKQRTLKKN